MSKRNFYKHQRDNHPSTIVPKTSKRESSDSEVDEPPKKIRKLLVDGISEDDTDEDATFSLAELVNADESEELVEESEESDVQYISTVDNPDDKIAFVTTANFRV